MVVDLTRAEPTAAERQYAADEVASGTPVRAVARRLAADGLDPDAARDLAAEAAALLVDAQRAAANRTFAVGLLWFVGGTAATVWGESEAGESGVYRVFWGAILIGGIQCLQGAAGMLRLAFRRGSPGKERANLAERYAGRGMLLGLAGGAAAGFGYGLATGDGADAFAGLLLGPIPGLAVGLGLGLAAAAVKRFTY